MSLHSFREKLYEIIFEADTKAGKVFDIALLLLIGASVLTVALESVPGQPEATERLFGLLEWIFTILFTLEYLLRLFVVKHPWRYARSFFGLVDLFSVLPTYLSLLYPGLHYMLIWRTLRLLRIVRVLKLGKFLREANVLLVALQRSRRKILVFFSTLAIFVIIFGTIMYVLEGPENGFESIPVGIYWAVVTMTTTGFGDVVPKSAPGQFIAAIVMLLGYAIIAVPTGIVSAEITRADDRVSTQVCPACLKEGHSADAIFCQYCGAKL